MHSDIPDREFMAGYLLLPAVLRLEDDPLLSYRSLAFLPSATQCLSQEALPDSSLLAFLDSRTIRNQSVYFKNDSVPGTEGEELAESIIQVQLHHVQTPPSCCQTPLALLWHFALFHTLRGHFSEGMNT